MDYSQFGEYRKVIRPFFERVGASNGIFVDIGAYGKAMSNTYNLCHDDNWAGAIFEPHPLRYEQCVQDFAPMKNRVVPMNTAIYPGPQDSMRLYLHEVPGHESLRADWIPETASRDEHGGLYYVDVPTLPLHFALNLINVPEDFDFLSIDTEGTEREILIDCFEKSAYRPRLICQEDLVPMEGKMKDGGWLGKMSDYGYIEIWRNKVNRVFEYAASEI